MRYFTRHILLFLTLGIMANAAEFCPIQSIQNEQNQNSIETTVRHYKKPHGNRRFKPDEDEKLRSLVTQYGERSWHTISKHMKNRSARQCKDRWLNYLSPNANHSEFSQEDREFILQYVSRNGPHWSELAQYFPGRNGAQIRNKWTTWSSKRNIVPKKSENSEQPVQDVSGFFLFPNAEDLIVLDF